MSSHLQENVEDSGSKETEQGLGLFETSGNQGQVTIEDDLSSGNSERSGAQKHKVSYEFLEFPYASLVTATGNFTDRISEGYYGSLYKGTLSDLNQEVAVKLLNNAVTGFSSDDLAKLAHDISRATHPNIVKFVGYCNEQLNKHILVYEFVPATLASCLHDSTPQMPPLDWATRMKILYGVAKGLDYLHNTMTPRVIYRDLKASNILLDGEGLFHPKLSGFGIGKFRHTGYCAPVHADNVKVSADCDIHCFGVVLLESLTGRKAYDVTHGSSPWILDWVRAKLLSDEESKKIQDPALKGKVEQSTFGKALRLAMMCTHKHMKLPDIEGVVDEMEYLTGQKVDNRLLPDFMSDDFESEAVAEAEEEEKKMNKNKKKKNKKTKKKKN